VSAGKLLGAFALSARKSGRLEGLDSQDSHPPKGGPQVWEYPFQAASACRLPLQSRINACDEHNKCAHAKSPGAQWFSKAKTQSRSQCQCPKKSPLCVVQCSVSESESESASFAATVGVKGWAGHLPARSLLCECARSAGVPLYQLAARVQSNM